jgi:hypothetical protein
MAWAATARGAPLHGLGKGIDLNDAVNPDACVLWDWNGHGGDEMVMIDGLKRRLVTTLTDSPSIWAGDVTNTRASHLASPVQLLLCDVDADGLNDLVLLDGVRWRVWLHQSRLAAGEVAANREGILPAEPTAADSGDFDGDGIPDLMIAPGNGSAPWVIFGFATAAPEARQFTQVSVNQAYVYPKSPSGRPLLVFAGGPYETELSGKTRIYQVTTGRALSMLDEIPDEGRPADLDGQYPPEIVTIWTAVYAKSSGQWSKVRQLDPFDYYPGGSAVYLTNAVEDFGGDGRDEVIFGWTGTSTLFALKSYGTPGEAELTAMKDAPVAVNTLSAVRANGSSSVYLTVFGSPTHIIDALGNPSSLPGLGNHAWLRRDPLNSWSPFDSILGPRRIAQRLTVADFNGDSAPDLGALHGKEGKFSVFEGPTWSQAFGDRPQLSGGFSGDSLVTGSFAASDPLPGVLLPKPRLTAVLRTSSRTESPPDIQFVTSSQRSLAGGSPDAPDRVLGAGDFDGDGDLDALVFNPNGETLTWIENLENGSVFVLHPIALAGRWWQFDWLTMTESYHWITQDQVLVRDADNDGDPDIITLPSALGNRLTLHRNHGGTFTMESLFDFEAWQWDSPFDQLSLPSHLLVGHFMNSSAPLQIAMFGPRTEALGKPAAYAAILHGNATAMTAEPMQAMPLAGTATACDFDGDGLDDLLTAGTYGTDPLGNPIGSLTILFHRSLGDGTFAAPVIVANPLGLVSQLVAADFTGDGLPDIAVTSRETGSVELFPHTMHTAYPDYSEWIASFATTDSVPDADPDGDGVANLVEFARGSPPDSTAPSGPLTLPAPVSAVIDVSLPYLVRAVHPQPRLAGGAAVNVALEQSNDMVTWSPVYPGPEISYNPAQPQWDILNWSFYKDDERMFYRFKVTYQSGN